MTQFATLALGSRADAKTWNSGMEALGGKVLTSVRKSSPSFAEISGVFSSGAEWIYLGGHFGRNKLYNESGDTSLVFAHDQITVKAPGGGGTILKNSSGFNLDLSCVVVLWGGCSVAYSTETITIMRKLFDQHVLLGFSGMTGATMVNALLGAGFIKQNHFFANLKGDTQKLEGVVQAWMTAASWGYGGGGIEDLFRAVDMSGQEWRLSGKKIVKGRKF
jgi:hypothetical protein